MKNITVFSNRLDESNGTVEHVLKMKTTAKKTPWFLRFATKAKCIVSFVQNLLSPLTRKEGVRGGPVSAFFQSAAAVVVGIGLLVGSTAAVQAACDPPVYDVCFHKLGEILRRRAMSNWKLSSTFHIPNGINGTKSFGTVTSISSITAPAPITSITMTIMTMEFMGIALSPITVFTGMRLRLKGTTTTAVPFTKGNT